MRKNNSFIGKEASVTTTKASGISSNINKFNYTKGGVWPYTLLNNVPPLVEYLVVGGGGGAGFYASGGGGAGGFRTGFYQITPATRTNSFNVIVGAGGASTTNGALVGNNGRDSRFASIHSVGGGAGWGYISLVASVPVRAFVDHGGTGGSGGGGMPNGPGSVFTAMNGGSGIAGQGYDGGKSGFSPSTLYPFRGGGGGGGGAGGKGGDYIENPPVLGTGGPCATSDITGVLTEYAGGGGGGGYNFAGYNGYSSSTTQAGAGQGWSFPYNALVNNATIPNRGSGGGGSGQSGGGSGSSGVVILAYSTAFAAITTITNLTHSVSTTSRPGYYVYTFTAHSGSGGTIRWS